MFPARQRQDFPESEDSMPKTAGFVAMTGI
jgi:hypothetical protein